MRIKKIEITNFKGFRKRTVALHEHLTVVIGNNTAGKTTLLKALQVALGGYLQCLKRLPKIAQYRRNFSIYDRYMAFDEHLRDYVCQPEKTRIAVEADYLETLSVNNGKPNFETKSISWYRELNGDHTTHTRRSIGELMDAIDATETARFIEHKDVVFPLVLSFGARRTSDAQVKLSSKVKERAQSLEKAYKFALHDRVDFEGAIEWLSKYDKNLRDKKEFEGTREAFFETLQTAIPALSEIEFDQGEIEAVVTVKGHQPERHHFSYMSDGLQAMINIVAEIIHRCIELNGFLGANAVRYTPGIVMIDEIDLYLHPHWQRHVLQDLQKAFPMIQFVVTTHSPFIVQSVQRGQLVSFDEGITTEGEPYKESLEDITEERMGLHQELRSKRFEEMERVAADYYRKLSEGEDDKSLLDALRQIELDFSDDPAYVALLRAEYKTK